jgi:hypothetical protein
MRGWWRSVSVALPFAWRITPPVSFVSRMKLGVQSTSTQITSVWTIRLSCEAVSAEQVHFIVEILDSYMLLCFIIWIYCKFRLWNAANCWLEAQEIILQFVIFGMNFLLSSDMSRLQLAVLKWTDKFGNADDSVGRLGTAVGEVFLRSMRRLLVTVNVWSSGHNSWLLTQRSLVRFPALSDFLSSSGSGTGSTKPFWG